MFLFILFSPLLFNVPETVVNQSSPTIIAKKSINIFASLENPTPISIQDCVIYDQNANPDQDVTTPRVFSDCLSFLMERGLDSTGLFLFSCIFI